MIAHFGSMLYHWHVTGELWVGPTRGSPGRYASYSGGDDFNVVFELGVYWLSFAFGIMAIFAGLCCFFLLLKSVFRHTRRAD
jgi:hypothetical protein